MLEAAPRSKLRDVVAARIKTYIRDENLRPGDRLPTEAELAERFGVSRLSLREATKALEFLGIVESKPGRGMSVGSVRMDRLTEYLGFHPALNAVPAGELIDTRVVIEIGALRQVAGRMKADPAIHANLSEINRGIKSARSMQRRIELDIEFHRGLIAASGLSPLLAFGDVLSVFFQRFRAGIKQAEWPKGIESHQRIIDSLRDGNTDAAEFELRKHIESHRERLEIQP